MERNHNYNQNQNQNQNQNLQRFNHNYQRLPRSATQQFQSLNSLYQNPTLGRNSLWINRNAPSNNDIIIGADLDNLVRNRMLNSVAIRRNLTERRDLLNPVRNQMPYAPIQEITAAQFNPVNSLRNQMRSIPIREYQIQQREHVWMLATTPEGCEYLRTILATEDGELRETILAIVVADLPMLMRHKVGSVFVRRLFFSCNEHQLDRVLQSVVARNQRIFLDICNNYNGSESAKTLIRNLKIEPQLSTVTNVLAAHISSFTNYPYAKNVLKFFIEACNHNLSRMRLFNAMANNCLVIAMNGSGSRVLQFSISRTFINSGVLSNLLDAIAVNALVLVNNKYGSYLIEHVIDANIERATKGIVGALMGRFCELAKTLIGSIVVEKCLNMCEPSEAVKIVEEFANPSQLPTIAKHRIGHHVLQSALKRVANLETRQHYRNLVECINLQDSTLRDHFYGKKVIAKIHDLDSNFPFHFHNKVYQPKSIFPS